MPNVLTNLAADIYKAADVVGREMVGFANSVTLNAGTEGVAVGQAVRSHFTRAAVATNIAPSMTIPEGTDQTIDAKTLTIDKQRGVQIPWTGEEIRYVNGGSGFETIYGDQIAQAMRTLVNEIEADLALEAYTNASRAVGTAGTNAFATNFNLVNEARQVLVDNGCPVGDGQVSLVMNTLSGTAMRNLAQLQKANEAGNDTLLRQGTLLDISRIMMKESGAIGLHTKGAATGALINNASGEGIGETTLALDTITVNTTGIKAGDVVTFAADATNKYVVNTGLVATAGNIVIGSPGARILLPDNNAMTIGNNYTPNVMFHRAAIELALRAPASPIGGDAASDTMIVQDPWSGLVFEISVYKGFKKTMIMVGVVWGKKAWKPDYIATLLG